MAVRTVLVFLGFLMGVSAFYPEWAISQAVDKAFEGLDVPEFDGDVLIAGRGGHRGHHEKRRPDPERCDLCVIGTIHHIMGAVEGHLKQLCESTECPFLQRKCKQAKEHPDVAYGFLLDHVDAHGKAHAFCYGRGVCAHAGSHCCCQERCIASSPLDNDFGTVADMISPSMENTVSLLPTMLSANNETAMNGTCLNCTEEVSSKVMKCVWHHAEEFCAKTECPCIKRKCEWAEKHKGVAWGILISKFHPAGIAFGYCMGNGTCHLPEHNQTMLAETNLYDLV